jgi:hypothetical protein
MANEIFRFVNLRQPREGGRDGIVLGGGDDRTATPLYRTLRSLTRSGAARSAFEEAAGQYEGSGEYAIGHDPLPLPLDRFDAWFSESHTHDADAVADAVAETLGRRPDELVGSQEFRTARGRIADSLLAQTIVPTSAEEQATLARWIRLTAIVERLPSADEGFDPEYVMDATIVLPDDVFPLPSPATGADGSLNVAAEEQRKAREAAAKGAEQLARTIEDRRKAIDELGRAFAADTSELRRTGAGPEGPERFAVRRTLPDAASSTRRTPGESGRSARRSPAETVLAATTGPAPRSTLSPGAYERLSADTRALLRDSGLGDRDIDVAHATSALEADVAAAAARLYRGAPARMVVRIRDTWVPVLDDGHVIHPGSIGWREPGPCARPAHDTPTSTEPTVPATKPSKLRPIGIADLLQVRQTVKRYELGEIAHIENVMMGEKRSRRHRQTSKTTETITQETERTTEESRDLQTTDRFELQQETSEILREESSREISLSVSGSYGPFVEGTATITAAQSESSEQSRKNAMRYSREVTDRAVKKVQERILERRTVTREIEFEEVNRHAFENDDGTDHIRGIYRFVDKIYEAQVVSYGLRMLFEVVVPEPAAFYRHALAAAPREGLRVREPERPGYCNHPENVFTPLAPTDLNEGNYQFWVGKYNVSDNQPPPPLYRTVGLCLMDEPKSGDLFTMIASNELQVPAGYRAERAFVQGQPILWKTPEREFVSFHVGRSYLPVWGSAAMNGEDGVIPIVGHGYQVAAMAVTVEVLCTRTREAFEAWQLATYGAIMTAYNDQRSQYESALARIEANLQNAAAVMGRSPEMNREIERTELKRAALSLITDQHFDQFDAMRRGVPPYGYPQADLVDARAEAPYIQFLEQAFEWGNMTYRFYPYFWGRKSEWPSVLALDDADELFGRFLQAGAARVQVPVRPGFQRPLVHLLQTGKKPWEQAASAFGVAGKLYVSMVDELTEEQRGAFTKGKGTVAVQQGGTVVSGTKTAFDEKLHLDREIILEERVYSVRNVRSATELVLDRPYAGHSAAGLPYSFGARLVGDPWEVRVPTNLVMLQDGQDLPVLPHP